MGWRGARSLSSPRDCRRSRRSDDGVSTPDVDDPLRLLASEVAVGRNDRRVQFATDRRDQPVEPVQIRTARPDFVRDFARCHCRPSVHLVLLSPREVTASASDVAVREVSFADECLRVGRDGHHPPFVFRPVRLVELSRRFDAVEVIDEKRRVENLHAPFSARSRIRSFRFSFAFRRPSRTRSASSSDHRPNPS